MLNSPDAVMLYIPLMKETNMTWEEMKNTPRYELEGLLSACYEYAELHSMDGYDANDISDMAKQKPSIRSDWNRYMEKRRKYDILSGRKVQDTSEALSALKSKL